MSAGRPIHIVGSRLAAWAALVAIALLAVLALALAPPAHGVSPGSRKPVVVPKSAADCGLGRGNAVYHGSDPNRNLKRAIPDPLKVVSYPCDFPKSVRGIDLRTDQIELVAGGELQRSIPFVHRGPATLVSISAAIDDPTWISVDARGVVTLNASLVQEAGTSLTVAAPVTAVHIVDNTTTTMVGSVSIAGSRCTAIFDGVTVTSWNSRTGAPDTVERRGRPFVLYENGSTFSINRSTFQYLGSDVSSSYGVSWRQGATGTVNHSVFDHNFFGVYTYAAKNILFENSVYSHNVYYGMDPHTYSSHLTIRHNTVFDNGHHGIVFSRFVTDSVVEDNTVYGNRVNGIMMDYRSDRNRIVDNTVRDNGQGIVFSGSADNLAYDNVLTGNAVGVRGSHDGANADVVRDNTITGGVLGIQVYGGATAFQLVRNVIYNTSRSGIEVDAPRTQLLDNTVTGASVGVVVDTAATVTGGSLSASKVGIQVGEEGFATVSAVTVRSADALAVAAPGWVHLSDTSFGVPLSTTNTPLLGILGICLLAFAVLCEGVHTLRRRRLSQVNAAAAGFASFQGPAAPATGRVRSGGRSALLTVRVVPPKTAAPVSDDEPARSTPASQRTFRPDIEGLRALSVAAVVLSHASLGVHGGFVGVDVFFVISGFLITGQLVDEANRRGRISVARFYARRIRRILPAATIVTTATLLASWHWASPLRVVTIAKDGLAAALFGINWRLAANGTNYFNAGAPPSPFQHYWSLSVEEQFYVVWPLVIFAAALLARRWLSLPKVLAGLLVAVIGVSFWQSVTVTTSNQPDAYFGTHTRVWELALGALLALGARRAAGLPTVVRRLLGWAGLAAIVFACVHFSAGTTYPGAAVGVPVLGAAAVIAAGCGGVVAISAETVFLKRVVMQLLGKISYSLYLWHWPLIVLGPELLGVTLSGWDRVLLVAIAVVLSIATYVLVEHPVRRMSSLVRHPERAFALGALLICVSVATAFLVSDLGAPATSAAPVATTGQLTAINALDASTTSTTPAALTAQLAAAATLQTLPSDLQPALKQASASFSDTKSCEVGLTATSPALPCDTFGDPTGRVKVLLIGDSHAGQWLDGISEVALQNHWRLTLLAKSGCPIGDYPTFVNPQLHRVYRECNLWRTRVITYVQQMKPALVIVGSETRAIAGADANGLYNSLTQLAMSRAKLVFLADTPSPRSVGSVPDCLAKHPDQVTTCDIPRDAAGLEAPGRIAEIQGAQRAGATVVDPTSWMCTARVCPAVIDHELVYADASHITGLFSELRVPQLSAALLSVLKH